MEIPPIADRKRGVILGFPFLGNLRHISNSVLKKRNHSHLNYLTLPHLTEYLFQIF